MRLTKSLKLALNILLHSKLRSWLTIIGIVIGVAAVVAIVSIGDGMQASIQSRLSGLGADIITISPGGSRGMGGFRAGPPDGGGGGSLSGVSTAKNLTSRDIQNIKSLENVGVISGTVSGKGDVYYLSETASSTSITGVDPISWNAITTLEIDKGRFLNPSDYNSVVLGSRIYNRTFKQPVDLNRVITIEGKAFKVVGILKESGSGDNQIIMPIDAARVAIPEIGNEMFNSITVKSTSTDAVDQLVLDIDAKLMLTRHLTEKKKDYSVSSAKAMQANMASVTQTLTLFLGAIAAVSLLVGAIGIANTMFTSVLEKTKEIGIMKAIGAKNRDIMTIFMLNAAMVGVVGGTIGIIFGWIASVLIPMIGMRMMGLGEMNTVVSPSLMLYAILMSIAIGVISGAIPAYRASQLRPVDALRSE